MRQWVYDAHDHAQAWSPAVLRLIMGCIVVFLTSSMSEPAHSLGLLTGVAILVLKRRKLSWETKKEE